MFHMSVEGKTSHTTCVPHLRGQKGATAAAELPEGTHLAGALTCDS